MHKQKIEQVSHWLAEAFDQGRLRKYRVCLYSQGFKTILSNISRIQRILALTGPSGIGKSATLRALAGDMEIQLIEWKNSIDDWKIGDSEDSNGGALSIGFPSTHPDI